MEYWIPKNSAAGLVGAGTSTLTSSMQYQEPKAELPEIGTKLLIAVTPYGSANVVNADQLSGNMDIVEVEVIAIKKSKITLE